MKTEYRYDPTGYKLYESKQDVRKRMIKAFVASIFARATRDGLENPVLKGSQDLSAEKLIDYGEDKLKNYINKKNNQNNK